MVDFRKWLFALAIVGLLLAIGSQPANAQNSTTFTCQATAGVPFLLRSEGLTELVGDLVLNCTGGTPTPDLQPIPLNNVQISINTNITSRIEDATTGASEALLLIDEPFPAANEFPPQPIGPTPKATNAQAQLACLAVNSTNCAITSDNNTGLGQIGTTGNYNGAARHYNIFQGFQNGTNAIAWDGVPIDAPGTAGTRVIRITNVRANAFALGVSSTLVPTSINMIVAVTGSSFITILQPSNGNIVGQITQGLVGTSKTASYQQCVNLNGELLKGSPGITDHGIVVSAREGFAAAFKPQEYLQYYNVAYTSLGAPLGPGNASYTGPGSSSLTTALQNVPGFNYNSESGFYSDASGLDQNAAEPAGLADRGTQIQFNIAGVGSGVSLFAPSYVYLTGNYSTVIQQTLGVAVLVSQTASGSGAITSSSSVPVAYSTGGAPTNGPLVSVAIAGTSASVTYEIYYADPSVLETLTLPITASYITTGPTNPAPTTTPATVSVNYAPASSVGTATATDPIPRFGQPYAAANFFTINSCSCNLLFPFVTNIAGFDTGVAIANTTADTLNGLAPQSGTVTLTYYGTTTGGGAAPANQVTTSNVPAGSELIFTLSNGGNYGILATPGFEGYIIARANFQYCHGFAFISDVGAQKLAEGYLALSLDAPFGAVNLTSRSGQQGENTAH